MPFDSVDDLKNSEAFQHSEGLQKMPAFRLRRFVEQFNRIYAAVLRRGGTEEEAERNAFALAFTAARRYQPPPMGATIEEKRHVFATMADMQFSAGAAVEINSFDFLRDNIDLVNAVVAGNSFNIGHLKNEPTGIIHRILLPHEVDASVREAEPDAPFFVEASYFEDTPDAIRNIDTVSAEWLSAPREDGTSEVLLPDSFAVTEDPATDRILGVGRVAQQGNLNEGLVRSISSEDEVMSDTPNEGLEAKVATLSAELESAKEKAAEADGYKKELETFKARLAGLVGVDENEDVDAETVADATVERIAGLENALAKTAKVVDEMKAADLQARAERFAEALFDEKEITVDAKNTWAELYVKDSETAEKMASTLPARSLRPGAGKAIGNIEVLNEKEAAAHLEYLKGAFQ